MHRKNYHRLIHNLMLSALVLLSTVFTAGQAQAQTAAADNTSSGIQGYEQTAPGEGWIQLNGRLFLTTNEGETWQDISPAHGTATMIQAVSFLNSREGWVLLAGSEAAQHLHVMARTTNGGAEWDYQAAEFAGLEAVPSGIAAAHMGRRDADLAWVVFEYATGSNFSAGALFLTTDGGSTWIKRSIPLGEPAYFIDGDHGWAAGGPAGDKLFATSDGGHTWSDRGLVEDGSSQATYSLPTFDREGRGILPVLRNAGSSAQLEILKSNNGGADWSLVKSLELDATKTSQARLPLAVISPEALVLHMPGTAETIQVGAGNTSSIVESKGTSRDIIELSMSGLESGWARWAAGDCSISMGTLECRREEKLLATQDGGASWYALPMPEGISIQENISIEDKTSDGDLDALLVPSDVDTQPYEGHGFDICEIANLTQLQAWWSSSPYSAVNLYIGGSARACANSALNATFLSNLNAQGWRFIPTWVGPQASCSYYYPRMSSNAVTAYNQGIAEADAAVNAAFSLGLTAPDKSGTIIYYDLEAYDITNSNCRAAANAFVSGWVEGMHDYNNPGAVYGASCGSAPTDWASIANPPDALWVANWYGSAGSISFDRTASVWDAYCLSNSLWSSHQRLRQYAGGHDETWGGVTLNIDSNVLDGPVTVPNGAANRAPSTPILRGPANSSMLPRTRDIWLQWKTTGDTCAVHVWGGSININSATPCSQYHLGVRAPGAYSWQVTAFNSTGSTTGPTWSFKIRPYAPSAPSATAVSATKVDVTWTLSADDAANLDGYQVFANGVLAGTVGPGVSTFRVSNLACNSLHTFYVKAVRQGVSSEPTQTVEAHTPSCAPVLSSPAEGVMTVNLRPTLSWMAVPDATGYQVQISLLPDFSLLKINRKPSGNTLSLGSDLAPNKLHYWRVRARGLFGNGDWSAARTFTTANPPGIPVPRIPEDGALVKVYTPKLDWAESLLPTGIYLDHYELQISQDAFLAAATYHDTGTASYFIPSTPLAENTTYYWQVRAFNTLNQNSSWSPKRSFRTAVLPPTLSMPADGITVPSLRPELDWGDVNGATSYTLQISTGSRFTTLWLSTSLKNPGYVVKTDLPRNTKIYWRVRTNAANGPSAWSVRSFTSPNPPTRPSLLSPVGNVTISDDTPVLDWTNSRLPTGTSFKHYQLQIATDSLFVTKLLDVNTGSGDARASSHTLSSPLPPNTRLFWRVRAYNTDDQYSIWSARGSFTIVP